MTKSKVAKEEPIHKDRIGQLIKFEDYVVYPDRNHLAVGQVKKLNNKMIGVSKLVKSSKGYNWSNYHNKYPEDCVIVDGARVTMLIMSLGNETR
jgi:hypothetical protein